MLRLQLAAAVVSIVLFVSSPQELYLIEVCLEFGSRIPVEPDL